MFDWYSEWEYAIASAQLAFTMLGIGSTLSPRDFHAIVDDPRGVLAGLGVQLLFVPLTAAAWAWGFGGWLDPGLLFGLLIIAAVPGGSISNIFTWLARGNVTLSIALTAMLTLAALFTTPFMLGILGGSEIKAVIDIPVGKILRDIIFFLLLPLGVGMGIGARLGAYRETFGNYCIRFGLLLVGLIVVGALGSGRIEVDAYGWSGPLMIVGFSLVILWGARIIAWLARVSWEDRIAIAIESTARNSNFAVLIAVQIFPATQIDTSGLGAGALFTILFFGGNSLVFTLFYMLECRWRAGRRDRKAAGEAASVVGS